MVGRRTGDDHVELVGVKFYADGWLGTRTCAMSRPFADDPDNDGVLFLDGLTLARRAEPYALAGMRLATHAVGDRAVAATLDGYAMIYGDAATCRQHAPLIEHAQVLSPELVHRLADWGVVVCLQPSFAVDDATAAAAALHLEQRRHAYAWNELRDAGVKLVSGSDMPVADARPLVGLQHLVTGSRLRSHERVADTMSVDDALALMTDAHLGTVTLSADPHEVDPHEIADIEVISSSPAF